MGTVKGFMKDQVNEAEFRLNITMENIRLSTTISSDGKARAERIVSAFQTFIADIPEYIGYGFRKFRADGYFVKDDKFKFICEFELERIKMMSVVSIDLMDKVSRNIPEVGRQFI